jgi:hypothetical protein
MSSSTSGVVKYMLIGARDRGTALRAEFLIMGCYNEADTRAKLIDPKVKLAGWGEGQIEREHYFVKGRGLGRSTMRV